MKQTKKQTSTEGCSRKRCNTKDPQMTLNDCCSSHYTTFCFYGTYNVQVNEHDDQSVTISSNNVTYSSDVSKTKTRDMRPLQEQNMSGLPTAGPHILVSGCTMIVPIT